MDLIQLTDLLEGYPDIDDDNFTEQIAAKHEFQLVANIKDSKLGESFPWQRVIEMMMSGKTPYKEMAFLWSVGRGKTKGALAILQAVDDFGRRFKNFTDSSKVDQRPLIVAKASLIESWKNEIGKIDKYTTEKLRTFRYPPTSDGESTRKSDLTNAIKVFFDLQKQDKLVLQLAKMTNAEIREVFHRPAIIWDEAQGGRTTIDHYDEDFDEEGIIKNVKNVKNSMSSKQKLTYVQMRRLFQLTNGVKIILTATPMYDKPEELPSVLNFILPSDKQLYVSEFIDAMQDRESLIEYLEPKLRGRVSWVGEEEISTVPVIYEGENLIRLEDGVPIETGVIVYPVNMSRRQWRVYKRAIKAESAEGGKRTGAENLKLRSRKASNFIYIDPRPDHRDSEFGFDGPSIEDDEDTGKSRKKTLNYEEAYVIQDPPLRKRAGEGRRDKTETKFSFRFVNEIPELLMKEDPTGFIPNDMGVLGLEPIEDYANMQVGDPLPPNRLEVVRRMSAKAHKVIVLAHQRGNWKYDNAEVTFVFNKLIRDGGGILFGMAMEFVGYERHLGVSDTPNIPDRARFGYMTGKPGGTSARNENIRRLANNPINMYGRKLLVVFGSEVASVGISFMNMRKFIHAGPDYSQIEQALGRTRRLDSHQAFPPQEKFVRVYLLAAASPDGDQNTVDFDIWHTVHIKGQNIAYVENILKRLAVDCSFHQDPLNRNGTCIDQDGDELVVPSTTYNTYHLFWATEEYKIIEQKIRAAFLVKSALTFGDLTTLMNGAHRPTTIAWTLASMLTRREVVQNRFGIAKILYEHNGVYYLGDVLPTINVSTVCGSQCPAIQDRLSAGSGNLIIPHGLSMREAYKPYLQSVSNSTEVDMDLEEFIDVWRTAMTDKRLIDLENALMGRVNNREIRDYILNYLSPTWAVNDDLIFHYYDEMRIRGTKEAYKPNRLQLAIGKQAPRIRVLKKGEDKSFRPATASELSSMEKYFKKRWETVEAQVMRKTGFNWILIRYNSADDQYRIKRYGGRSAKTGKIDKRTIKRGRVLNNVDSTFELIDLLWDMQIPSRDQADDIPDDMDDLAEEMMGLGLKIDDWDEDRLVFYYNWKHVTQGSVINTLVTEAHNRDIVVLR